MSYPNYVYSLFAFIGFVVALIPLRWHLDAWNAGTCLYMLWTAIACLNQFINSVVWNGRTVSDLPGWCDISVRIIVGASTAIPAASLCINRRLYRISRLQTAKVSDAEKRREMIVDFAIALGLPIFFIIISYIPQGHRYDIFEDIGCVPIGYATPVYVVLVQFPPVAIGCVTAVYSVLSIRAFVDRQKKLQELMAGCTSMNTNRYFRLMCLAGIEVMLTIPLGCFMIVESININGGIHPWISWADTHWGFNRHDTYPATSWRDGSRRESVAEFSRWLIIICAFVFFAFFGFAEEARYNYRAAFRRVASWFGHEVKHTMPSPSGIPVKKSNMTFAGRRVTIFPATVALNTEAPQAERGQPKNSPGSKCVTFIKRILRVNREPPLLPITFAPNTFSPRSSQSSESRDPIGVENLNDSNDTLSLACIPKKSQDSEKPEPPSQ